jgi:hypothetical protein
MTLMLTVLVGLGLLALDGARFMSLQTQMQAAADALALAGARELNQQSGAQARAISAMANAYGSATVPNTLSGMGITPTLTYTYTFYKSLPAATAGLTGTAAAGDTDSKYVQVTIAPQQIPTIFPVPVGANSFSTGASAIAGFAGIFVCGVTPIFICNPYEDAGDSDAQATQDLYTAYNTPARLRKMFRMDRTSISPGHFGWVQTPDGCNNTACMQTNIAQVNGACYDSNNVQLATGNNNQIERYFDTRFDIPTIGITAANAPSVNVRKGYVPLPPIMNWCNAMPQPPPKTTSGLPPDNQWTGLCAGGTCLQGNGDWNCAAYWSLNHTAAAPSGCTSSNPTISRYQVYRYEIANGLVNDWSENMPNPQGTTPPGTESGAPYCATSNGVSGVDITTGGLDRRNIIVPIINCLAQTALGNITGGNTANVPVAAFGKFFLTQPYTAPSGGGYLYGEMTGLTTTKDNVVIYNNVQLYR